MSPPLKFIAALAVSTLVVAAAVAVLAGLVWSGLAPEQQVPVLAAVTDRLGAVAFVSLMLVAGWGGLLRIAFQAYVLGPRRLAEETRLILDANPGKRIECDGPAELAILAAAINALAARCQALATDVDLAVAGAKASLEQERNRLAALMGELTESVVVCNIAGTVLLYNQRGRALFSSTSEGRTVGGTPGPIGLGRSVFGIIDRHVIAHALEQVEYRRRQGDELPVVSFATTTRPGRLIRVRMAPVLASPAESRGPGASGFVLVLNDIGRDVEFAGRRDRLLRALTEGTRSSLAGIRAAVENLLDHRQMAASQHEQFLHIIHDEAAKLTSRLDQLNAELPPQSSGEWPLAAMLGGDLLSALQRAIEARLGMAVAVEAVDGSMWLNADSYLLVEALTYLADRLRAGHGVQAVMLRLRPEGAGAGLDLRWHGGVLAVETALQWERSPIVIAGEPVPLTFNDIVQRHAGEAWYGADPGSGMCYFRVLLQLAEPEGADGLLVPSESRPVYYDFDLFHQPGQNPDLDERALAELSYTVFDTETTGLDPSRGDEIVAIGAVRIVNSKLLIAETFEQLVNPGRSVPSSATRIHGITEAMLRNQPSIDAVLPGFHGLCADTVLVAHNAAFDMRFLQLKEPATGVRFSHPVLDTLMLSAVLHPDGSDHSLEAIAARYGVSVIGRHTALGDAMVTGEIFLKMIPLLREKGIVTLRHARDAAAKTTYARIGY